MFYQQDIANARNPNNMVNDNIVDFGIGRILRDLSPEIKDKFHIYNVFFLTKLMEIRPESQTFDIVDNYQMVKKWTSSVDIFSKEFLVIPNFESKHFSLLLVIRPGLVEPKEGVKVKTEDGADMPCLLHMDPLVGEYKGSYHDGDKLASVLYTLVLNYVIH